MFEKIKALFKDTRKDVELELLHKTGDGQMMWAELYVVNLYGTGDDTTVYNREYVKHVLVDIEEIQQEQAKVDVLIGDEHNIDSYRGIIL